MVDNLTIDEVKQLVNFYRQKSSDLELQVLQLQLKIGKMLSVMSQKEEPKPAVKTRVEKNTTPKPE